MKVAIGFEIKSSSWGGGNQFAKSLVKALLDKGHKVTHNLVDSDIDIILLTDPRSYNDGVTFGSLEIIKYLMFKNNKAMVIHRINECDERKNTYHINKLLKWSNYCADYTVFIASWLKNLDLYHKYKPSQVILNGGDKKIFSDFNKKFWNPQSLLKLSHIIGVLIK